MRPSRGPNRGARERGGGRRQLGAPSPVSGSLAYQAAWRIRQLGVSGRFWDALLSAGQEARGALAATLRKGSQRSARSSARRLAHQTQARGQARPSIGKPRPPSPPAWRWRSCREYLLAAQHERLNLLQRGYPSSTEVRDSHAKICASARVCTLSPSGVEGEGGGLAPASRKARISRM